MLLGRRRSAARTPAGLFDSRNVRGAEMHGKEQRLMLGAVFQDAAARDGGLLRQFAEARIPVRCVDLQRMVDRVAADHGVLASIASSRMTWPGVCPGAGSISIVSSIACAPSSSTDWPASITGSTLSR